MTDDVELRRLALEERKAADSLVLRQKELEIEAARTRREPRGQVGLAAISALSAVFGAAASLGAAYVAGVFSVQETSVQADATSSLEQQKFSYDLITTALSEPEERARAQRLRFLVDVGLLDNLEVEKIREYAEEAEERLDRGDATPSKLPQYESTGLTPQIRENLEPPRIGRRCGLPVRQIPPQPDLIECVQQSFPGLSAGEVRSLVTLAPVQLANWLGTGALPPDWRAALDPDNP